MDDARELHGTCLRATADGSATLFDEAARQTFHSRHGAVREARHVFLGGAGLEAGGPGWPAQRRARVLEVGFGTGLNFLLTADAARHAGTRVHYLGLDRRLPPASTLRQLRYGDALDGPDLFEAFLSARDAAPERGPWTVALPGADLTVHLGNAEHALLPAGWADAIYHDAFSPEASPSLWDEAFLARLVRALAPGGRLVSYCVQGRVRRRLAALGLEVGKRPGPPAGKREVLHALNPTAPAPRPTASPTR